MSSNEPEQTKPSQQRAILYAIIVAVAVYYIYPRLNRTAIGADILFLTIASGVVAWWISRSSILRRISSGMDHMAAELDMDAKSRIQAPAEPVEKSSSPPLTNHQTRPNISTQIPTGVKVYSIRLPRDTQWRPELAHALIKELAMIGDLALRIVAEGGVIQWQILDLDRLAERNPELIASIVQKVYPEAEVNMSLFEYSPFTRRFYRSVDFFQTAGEFVLPIAYASNLSKSDPLALIVNDMSKVEEGETVSYTVYLGKPHEMTLQQMIKDFEELALQSKFTAWDAFNVISVAGWFNLAAKGLGDRPSRYPPAEAAVINEKFMDVPPVLSYVMFEVSTPNEDRIKLFDITPNLLQLGTSYQTLMRTQVSEHFDVTNQEQAERTSPVGQLLKLRSEGYKGIKPNAWKSIGKAKTQPLVDPKQCIFNPGEIAALWHVPTEQFSAQNIDYVKSRTVPLPTELRGKTEGVCLGEHSHAGRKQDVFIHPVDRSTHMIVLGKTGTGKSTFMHSLIHQDIAAGYGVAVIDPSPIEDSLVTKMLWHSIPAHRENDVVVWDLSNREYPPPLNLLRPPPGLDNSDYASNVMAIFEKIYGEAFSQARRGSSLAMGIEAALADTTPTLRDIVKLVRDNTYRRSLTAKLDNPAAEDFWDRFEDMRPGEAEKLFEAVLYRIEKFYGSKVMYPVMCHPHMLDIGSYIQQKKIILISLASPKGAVVTAQDQALLGSILVSQFQMAFAEEKSKDPFYLYIDEAEHFVTTSLAHIFNEARKRNLSLTLGNQYLKQLAGDTLDAVMGNFGALVSFRVGDDDGDTLQKYTKPQFASYDLTHMPDHNAAVFMKHKGSQQPTFNINTRPAPQAQGDLEQREQYLRGLSQKNYTPMSRKDVLDWLGQRYPRRNGGRPENDMPPPPSDDDISDPV